jgi:hypothetical protein
MQNIVIDASATTSVVVSSPQQITPAPVPEDSWQRPASWLPMPTVTGSEQIVATLFPVFDTSVNVVSFVLDDACVVDWGDGIVENFAAGSEATHNYIYSNIPSSTNTPFGYRQALIKITPQSGGTLNGILLGGFDDGEGEYLDIVASGPSLFLYGTSGLPRLQHIKVLCLADMIINCANLISLECGFNTFSTSSTASIRFNSNPKLKYISNFSTGSKTDFSNMFNGCSSLERIPDINFSLATNMSGCFRGCSSLTYVPAITLSGGACNFNNCFNGCSSLQSLNITGSATNISGCFTTCVNLAAVPPINISACNTLFGVCSKYTKRFLPVGAKNSLTFDSTGYERFGRTGIVEIFNNLGTANPGSYIKVSTAYGFSELTNNDKLIATNKGWTIT